MLRLSPLSPSLVRSRHHALRIHHHTFTEHRRRMPLLINTVSPYVRIFSSISHIYITDKRKALKFSVVVTSLVFQMKYFFLTLLYEADSSSPTLSMLSALFFHYSVLLPGNCFLWIFHASFIEWDISPFHRRTEEFSISSSSAFPLTPVYHFFNFRHELCSCVSFSFDTTYLRQRATRWQT